MAKITDTVNDIITKVNGKANLSGATFTGQAKGITPVSAEDLTRKDYVDSQAFKNLLETNYAGDMNALFASGQYVIGQSATNIPIASKYYSCIIYGNNGVSVTSQTLVERVSGVTFVRSHNGTAWSAWIQLGALGTNQVWTNVTASRSLGVTYTNTTGRPITVIYVADTHSGESALFYVDGLVVARHQNGNAALIYPSITVIVPANSTYRITKLAGGGGVSWYELR